MVEELSMKNAEINDVDGDRITPSDHEITTNDRRITANDHKITSGDKTCCIWLSVNIGLFFLFLLPAVAVAINSVTLLGPSSTPYTNAGLAADVMLIITYVIIIFATFIVIASNEKNGSDSNEKNGSDSNDNSTPRPNNNSTNQHHSNIAITLIFILGVGDSLFNLTRGGNQLISIINPNSTTNSSCFTNISVSTAENFIESLCQLCILTFLLYQLKYATKCDRERAKVFQMCLAIFCFTQWVQILLQEVYHYKKKHDSCISNTTSGVKAFDRIEPFLYPLGLEFRSACFIQLLIISEDGVKCVCSIFVKPFTYLRQRLLLRRNNNVNMPPIIPSSSISNSERHTIINKFKMRFSSFRCDSKERKSVLRKYGNSFASIILSASGILLASISLVIVFFQVFNTDDHLVNVVSVVSNKNPSLITLISEICEIILAIIILLITGYSLYQLRPETNTARNQNNTELNTEFKIDFGFLAFANILLCVYCCITFVGSVLWEPKESDGLTEYIRVLTYLASCIAVIQTILQSIVIWKARQYKGKLTGEINKMWIILSFALWIFDTFSAKDYKTNTMQNDFYREKWDYIAPFFVPMAIFYRFHSCIIFANINDGVYWDEHNNDVSPT